MKVIYARSTAIYNDSRATKEIKTLLKHGYHVTVLAWDREGISEDKIKNVFNSDLLSIHLFKKELKHGSGIKGLFKTLSFCRWINKNIKILRKETNIVHLCDLDTALFSYKTIKKLKLKLVYDIYDYYTDSRTFPKLIETYLRWKESKIIESSDATIICTEQRKEQIGKAKYNKLEVIHNSPEDILNQIKPAKLKVPENCKIITSFIGVLSENRLLEEILDKIDSQSSNDIFWIFAGQGMYRNKIEQLASHNKNVIYLGSLPYSEVLSIEQQCDFLFATYNPKIKNHKYSAPNKVYEAMMLEKPVIVCEETGIDKLVLENGIGLTTDYSAESFFNKIAYLKDNPIIATEMGKKARNLYKESFSWEIMESRIKKMYEKL